MAQNMKIVLVCNAGMSTGIMKMKLEEEAKKPNTKEFDAALADLLRLISAADQVPEKLFGLAYDYVDEMEWAIDHLNEVSREYLEANGDWQKAQDALSVIKPQVEAMSSQVDWDAVNRFVELGYDLDMYALGYPELTESTIETFRSVYNEANTIYTGANEVTKSYLDYYIYVYIEDMESVICAIERKGGIPVNNLEQIERIKCWDTEIYTERTLFHVTGKDLLENESIKKKLMDISMETGDFFLKTKEKDFSGVIPIHELFEPFYGLIPALQLHKEDEFIVGETVSVLRDQLGTLEYRCFVVDEKY